MSLMCFCRCNHVTTKTSKQSDDNRLCRYLLTDICPHPLHLRGCPLCLRWWIRITLDLGRCFGHLFVFSTCRFQGSLQEMDWSSELWSDLHVFIHHGTWKSSYSLASDNHLTIHRIGIREIQRALECSLWSCCLNDCVSIFIKLHWVPDQWFGHGPRNGGGDTNVWGLGLHLAEPHL